MNLEERLKDSIHMFILVSGIKILATIVESTPEEFFLKQPVELIMQPDPSTSVVRIGCLDFTPEAKNRDHIGINKSVVACSYEVVGGGVFAKQYEDTIQKIRCADSGLVLPKGIQINS